MRPVDSTKCSPGKLRDTGGKAADKLHCYAAALHTGNPVLNLFSA